MFGFVIVVGLAMIATWARMLIFPDRINIIAIIVWVSVGCGYSKEIISGLDDGVFDRFGQISSSGRDSKALVRVDIKSGRLDYLRCPDTVCLKGMRWVTRRARHFHALFLQSNSIFEAQWPRILSYAVEGRVEWHVRKEALVRLNWCFPSPLSLYPAACKTLLEEWIGWV